MGGQSGGENQTLKLAILFNFVTVRQLTGKQESSDQLTLTTDRETGKSFEPSAQGNLRFGVQPLRQQDKLFG